MSMDNSLRQKDKYYWLKCVIVAVVFAAVILLIHKPMDIISDDAVHVGSGIKISGLFEFMRARVYGVGRFLTDAAGYIGLCMPFRVWKCLDTLIYVAILLVIWDLFTDRSVGMLVVTAAGICMFPITHYLSSAGYVMTTANYIYPLLALLIGFAPVIRTIRDRRVHVIHHAAAVLGIIFASNQDQSAVIAIGGFLLIAVASPLLVSKEDRKRVLRITIIYLAVAVISYAIMFLTPGHMSRMGDTTEMERWLPQYADWGFGTKVCEGLATTFANIFFQRPTLFMWFCYLILITVFIENRSRTVIPALLLAVVLACSALDYSWFIRFYDHTLGLPDLVPLSENPLPFIISMVIFILMILSVLSLYKTNRKLCITLVILNILGFGSRFMMGFSATLFASSYRTFTFQLFCFLICDVVMINRILKKIGGKSY